MNIRLKVNPLFGLLAMAVIVPVFLSGQTSPDSFLGFKPGTDRKLADYAQIQAYFQKLDQESPLLKVMEIGKTTLGKPMIMAVITSEENMDKLDTYRGMTKRLRDPRTLAADEAKKLAREGKAIIIITCSLHSSEIAASQMSMELAHKLVKGETPFDAGKVLNDVILLLVPTSNPDGHQLVTEWYRKYVGTQFEGGSMPWLYHHYAGHDDNRDWFMFNLAESRNLTRVFYHDWLPLIHLDEHQMGSNGPRLFIPPFMDPPIPNVQPLVWRGVNLMGTSMAYDLQKNGFSGVVNGRSYTGWWIGACDDTPWLHNSIGLLSEAASVRIASPIFIEPSEVPNSVYSKQMDFLDPWPGGWWRLRDIVDYELTLSLSLIKTASLHREDLLLNSYQLSKNSIEKMDKNQPYAFVISAKQHDYPTMLKMLDVVMTGGVEVHQAKEDFVADGKLYPAGSFVVKMAQPFKPYAWALLERQKYPDIRQYPGGPPQPPYDNAGWTLPLQMGVACDEVKSAFQAKLEKIDKVPDPPLPAPRGNAAYFLLNSRVNASYSVAVALLREGAEIWRSQSTVSRKGIEVPAGTFIIKNTPEVKKTLPAMLAKHRLALLDLDDIGDIAKSPIKFPRVAVYQSWRGNMDEGWTRYMLDEQGVPFTTLHNEDIKGTKEKKADLKANYDVIVFASESADVIMSGRSAGGPRGEGARPMQTPSYPPEYEGGIEKEGVEALKAFVEQGGIVIALNAAVELATREFEAPARNALQGVDRTRFFCPTSLLNIRVDNQAPIGYGMPDEAVTMFASSLALDTFSPAYDWERKVVATFPDSNVLASGWLLGEEVIARKAVVVDTRYKKGRFILIGTRAQNRAQTHGTYKFILNGLLYPEAGN